MKMMVSDANKTGRGQRQRDAPQLAKAARASSLRRPLQLRVLIGQRRR